MEKKYLLYQITNLVNGKIYIGIHVTDNLDDGYLGSGTAIKRAIKIHGKENFIKEILEECESLDDLYEKEAAIVTQDFINRKDTYNLTLGGRYIPMIDKISVRDSEGNTFRVACNDPRYLSGELKHVTCGRVTVVDSVGNSMSLLKEDERIKLEGLQNPFKNKKHNKVTKHKISEGHRGSKNINFGKVYIMNLNLKENKLVKKDEVDSYLRDGWIFGRKYEFFK